MTAEVSPRTIRRLFVAAVTLGAFLLLMAEALAARVTIDATGGGPAAWGLALLIYQTALLLGFAYAGAVRRWSPLLQAALQFVLLILALLWAPTGSSAASSAAAPLGAAWRGPALLALSLGPLVIALSAQAPLLQRWLLLRQPGAHPYPLFRATQFAGIAGLLGYALLAPVIGVAMAWPWLGGYIVLLGLFGGVAATLPRRRRHFVANLPVTLQPPLQRRLGWLMLAALPFALMLATTARLGADSGAMAPPWLVPLGVYLASLAIAFVRGRAASAIAEAAAAVMVIAGSLAFASGGHSAIVPLLGLVLLFFVSVALHFELHRRRPDPAHLVGFHLILVGGALIGGAVAALAWTALGIFAYPLLVLAAAVFVRHRALTLLTPLWRDPSWRQGLAIGLSTGGVLLSMICMGMLDPLASSDARFAAGLAIGALALAALGRRWLFVGMLGLTMLAFGGWQLLGIEL